MYTITRILIKGITSIGNIQIKTNDLEAIRTEYAKKYNVEPRDVKFIYEMEIKE